MTDLQLYLSGGLPTLAVLIGILINATQVGALEGRMNSLESRMSQLDNRMVHLESKFDNRFDMLLGKVVDLHNRLTRFKARFER